MMNGVIVQPSFLPWRGFFHLIHRSDVFVFLDDVQYDKRSWRNRNTIKTPQGLKWLTVPVETRGKYSQTIVETKICNVDPWKIKILKAIEYNYKKTLYFDLYFRPLAEIIEQPWIYLADLDICLIEKIMEFLNLKIRTLRSSRLERNNFGKNEQLIDICKNVGITHYISGPSAAAYLNADLFEEHGISVEYMRYEYPPYQQLYLTFEPQVSIIDLLFNEGPKSSQYIWG